MKLPWPFLRRRIYWGASAVLVVESPADGRSPEDCVGQWFRKHSFPAPRGHARSV